MITFIIVILGMLLVIKIIQKLTAMKPYDGFECLVGKVAIVTGGSRGIGLEVSKYLASRGCKVIIACRTKEEQVVSHLAQLTHNQNITVRNVDFRSFKDVREFADAIHETETKIDILINNAGIGMECKTVTEDGQNTVMQVNAFSPFLLTHLLIDLLKKSDDPRIVFTTSSAAFYNNLSLDNLTSNKLDLNAPVHLHFLHYGNSKLALVIMSKIFSEKVKKYRIATNSVHPGLAESRIYQGIESKPPTLMTHVISKWFLPFIFCYGRSLRETAEGTVRLAISDEYRHVTGKFFWGFGMSTFYPSPRVLSNDSLCLRFWEKMESVVKLRDEEKL